MPTAQTSAPAPPARPLVAFIANGFTPYREAVYRRIVDELPQIDPWFLYTHDTSNAPWEAEQSTGHVVRFGAGEPSAAATSPRRALHEWRKAGRIIRWLKERHARAVVLQGYNDVGRLRLLCWGHRHRVPILLFGDSNIRGDLATGLKAAVKQMWVRAAVRWSAAVLPCGSLGRAYFTKYGAADDRMFYFPYEPDYERFSRVSPDEIDAARLRFDLPMGRRRLMFSGRLESVKRTDLLIAAFAGLASQRPDWDLLIVGDGPLAEELRQAIPKHLTTRVAWTRFIREPGTMAALYHTADVLVLPSDYEPWAVVINEAAAAGLAIVCSDVVGAAEELVREGVNGFTFSCSDGDALLARLVNATVPERIDALKAGSAGVLAEWRQRGDPVAGLTAALRRVGLAV